MPKIIAVMPLSKIAKLPPGVHAVAPNLYLKITATGGRSWIFRYRDRKGNSRRTDIGLGSANPDLPYAVSRDDAIEAARRLMLDVREGRDPVADKREKAIERALSGLTFEDCARRFHKANEAGWSASHAGAWLREMESMVFPVFGQLGIERVTVKEVLAAIEPFWTTKHDTAARNRGRIEKTVDWAVAMRHRPDGKNPAIWKGGLEAILAKPKMLRKARGEQHLAALDWRQLPSFVAKLRGREDIAARALEFTILTASRSNEVRDMEWSEVDFERRVWTIPAARMKARREHHVPLCARALAILQGLPRTGYEVFPINRDSMIDIVKELAGDFTTHGFRSSFSSWAGECTQLPRDVVERVLSHQTGSAVEQAYRRGQEIERRATVLNAWEKFVNGGSTQDQVVVDIRAA